MIRLVVNAEEFGKTPTTNRAIIEAHLGGIVTSTALAGNFTDGDAPRALLDGAPRLGVGLALALTGGAPVAPPDAVPSLLTPRGDLREHPLQVAFDWMRGHIVGEQVEREFEAQLARAQAAGLAPDHLCTRGHLGFLPGVGQIVERLARKHSIPGIRTSVEPATLTSVTDPRRGIETSILSGLAWLTRRRLGALKHGPRTWGYVESGRLDEVRILEILGRMGPGAHELVCHPGETEDGDAKVPGGGDPHPAAGPARSERSALMSTRIKSAIERLGIVLCRWRDLF
jgi:chitin disaccharide deacetylase